MMKFGSTLIPDTKCNSIFLKRIPFITRMENSYVQVAHPIDEKQFWELLETHRQDMIRELTRGDVYKEGIQKHLKITNNG